MLYFTVALDVVNYYQVFFGSAAALLPLFSLMLAHFTKFLLSGSLTALFTGLIPMVCAAQSAGPEKRWLINAGGGGDKEAEKRFVTLSARPNGDIVLIHTALSAENIQKA